MGSITAVVFDLDGLLADTERLHQAAYREAFRRHGIALADQDYEEHWIRRGRGIEEYVAEHGLAMEPDRIRHLKTRLYHELVTTSAQPMPGALALLGRLRGHRRLALASSAYPEAVEAVLAALRIKAFFEVVVTRGDVHRVKPHPDIFLVAAQRLGVAPAECVVLEDAEKGVAAARAAGMLCLAVPNLHTRRNDFGQATRVLGSLDEVTLELLDSLG